MQPNRIQICVIRPHSHQKKLQLGQSQVIFNYHNIIFNYQAYRLTLKPTNGNSGFCTKKSLQEKITPDENDVPTDK